MPPGREHDSQTAKLKEMGYGLESEDFYNYARNNKFAMQFVVKVYPLTRYRIVHWTCAGIAQTRHRLLGAVAAL